MFNYNRNYATNQKRTVSLNLETLLTLLKNKTGYNPRISGAGYICGCPAHNDRYPSLSVTEKPDRILIHCHRGCSPKHSCDAINIKIRDLFLNKEGHSNG